MKFSNTLMISLYTCILITLSTSLISAQTIIPIPDFNPAGAEKPKNDQPAEQPREESKDYIIPKGTIIRLVLKKEINSTNCRAGDPIELKLPENFIQDGKLLFPQNSVVLGKIVELQKLSLIKDSYNLIGEVEKVETPFGKDYPLKGRLDFEFVKKSSKKGSIFSFKIRTDDPADLFPDNTPSQKKYKKGDDPLVIPVDTELDLHLEEDNVITIKRKM